MFEIGDIVTYFGEKNKPIEERLKYIVTEIKDSKHIKISENGQNLGFFSAANFTFCGKIKKLGEYEL